MVVYETLLPGRGIALCDCEDFYGEILHKDFCGEVLGAMAFLEAAAFRYC
ncbi:hypothetical protein BY996DRAFT_6534715 [Phakopsora pachyrhizi]|nr:hypothetical protein BY996DRAFT_6534715 [Phakopsora pachyrhizi]